jgi:hypothetical protein
MDNRDQKLDRAEQLFEQVKPDLIKILHNAPQYGAVGFDIVFSNGQITRVIVRAEMARKLIPQEQP